CYTELSTFLLLCSALRLSMGTSTCPVCRTPYDPTDTTCTGCGLIFASFGAAGAAASPPAIAAPLPAPPAPSDPLRPGQPLDQGRYTVQRVLSRGGMGALYLATDHNAFGRTVVVKALLDYFDSARPEELATARERFLQEARTLAELKHPTIPQIFTAFQD